LILDKTGFRDKRISTSGRQVDMSRCRLFWPLEFEPAGAG
jgi:hypothetical protein